MKFFLTSTGITNKSMVSKLFELVGKRPEDMAVAYVPTAINVASVANKRWAIDNIRRLDDLRIGTIDIVDFAAIPKEMWLPRLENSDVIYVEGGTPAYLKDEMEKAGLIGLFSTNFANKVYVGCSSGSSVLGKKIIKSTTEEPGYNIIDGFGLMDFSIRPHYGISGKALFTHDLMQELAEELETSFYLLDDNSGIVIEDGDLEVVSEGKWELIKKTE